MLYYCDSFSYLLFPHILLVPNQDLFLLFELRQHIDHQYQRFDVGQLHTINIFLSTAAYAYSRGDPFSKAVVAHSTPLVKDWCGTSRTTLDIAGLSIVSYWLSGNMHLAVGLKIIVIKLHYVNTASYTVHRKHISLKTCITLKTGSKIQSA